MNQTITAIGATITEILLIQLEDILLEIIINLQKDQKALSLKLSIFDDGETIGFNQLDQWISKNDTNCEVYSCMPVQEGELAVLLNKNISKIFFGIGKTIIEKEKVIYFIKLEIDEIDFLFYNNGDKAAFAFLETEQILNASILECEWVEYPNRLIHYYI